MSEYLSAAEVQRLLGISAPTFYRWVKSGKLVGTRAGRRWRFSRSVVERLLTTPSPIVAVLLARLKQRDPESVSPEQEDEMLHNDDPTALARLALHQAHAGGAQSLHLEPAAGGWQLRERIDGRLTPMPERLTARIAEQMLAGLKAVVGMPDGQRYGRGQVMLGGHPVNLRLTVFPTSQGESAAIRLIDLKRTLPVLDELYLAPELIGRLRVLAQAPAGVFLTNGPAGSGKTTTLYMLLQERTRPHIKVMSIEHTVPLLLDGVQQCEVESIGSFSEGIQMMMRSDVDVAMVGEIPDAEVARQVFTMAATGHQVFSTMHAPDAGSALRRLKGACGLPPSLITETLLGILDQRLVPLSCPRCRRLEPPTEAERAALGLSEEDRVARNDGCAHCEGRGVRGRTAIAALHDIDTLAPLLSGPIPSLVDALMAALIERVAGGDVRPEEALVLHEQLRASDTPQP